MGAYEDQLEKAETFLLGQLGEDWKKQIEGMDLASRDRLMFALWEQGITHPMALSKILHVSGQHIKKVRERLDEKRKAADEEAAKKIRESRKDVRKPIMAKEIEDAAWFHNLLHDLGNYAYHRLVKYVDWGFGEIEDPKQAFDRLSAFLDGLMRYREDAARLQKVEMERDVLDMYLVTAMDFMDQLIERVKVYKWLTDLMIGAMCARCKQQVVNQMVVSGGGGWMRWARRGTRL